MQRSGSCWSVVVHGSAPSQPSLHLPSSNISMMYVVIGATQLTQPGPGAQVRSIKQVVMHQYYNHSDMSYDIALLELDHPVQCSPYIQLACVPDATLRVSELRNCWIAGWGSTAPRGEFPRETPEPTQHTGDTAWASPQQRPKSGCGTHTSAEMDLVWSPKADSRGTAPQCLCRGKDKP